MKNIAKALLEAQKTLDPIHKGKKGYGYTYADLAAVLNELTNALNDVGVVIIQSPARSDKQAACVVTRLIHADSGEEITSEIEVPWAAAKGMNDAQAYGSAITYAKRYALVSMMGVVTEDDDGAKAAPKKEATPIKTAEQVAREKAASFVSQVEEMVAGGADLHEISGLVLDGFKGTIAATANAVGDKYPDIKARLAKVGF